MEKAYGYIRVSTETQADKGYGLETQRNAIVQYCAENDFELVRIFSDEGISGKLGDSDSVANREGLLALMNSLDVANNIVVMHTSRLWRDESAKVVISRAFRKAKGEIHSVEQDKYSLYSNDPQEFLFNSMLEMLDQYDRMCINSRLKSGIATKAKGGDKPCGIAPYGYKYHNKVIIVNQVEKPVIQSIYALKIDGCSLQSIADRLNATSVPTRRGGKWLKQSVATILNNDFYIGILTHQGKKYVGNHEPIIDKEDWDMVGKGGNSSKIKSVI